MLQVPEHSDSEEDDGTDEELAGHVAGSRTSSGAIGSEGRWLFTTGLVTMSNVLLLSALLTASPLNTGHAKGRPSLNFVLSVIDRRCKRCGRPTAPDRGLI